MSGSINNNMAIRQDTNDYNIDDKQAINTNTKPTKTTKSSGINSISYGDEAVKQITQDTKDNLAATLLTQDPEITGKMVTELCSSLPAKELKATAKESLDIIKDITTFTEQNIKTSSNTPASSIDLNSLVGNFSSFDIRELMKLLIQAYAQFFSTQRELDLATTNMIQQAMETKIAAMEKEKDETYKAAMAQAIGSIVSGSCSILSGCCSVVSGAVSIKGAIKADKVLKMPSEEQKNVVGIDGNNASTQKVTILHDRKAESNIVMNNAKGLSDIWNGAAQSINGLGGIANGIASIVSAGYTKDAKEAQIEQTQQDAALEILKKMQQEGSEQTKQLMEFISRILSMIQELQQAAAQTEKTIVQA